MVEAGELPALRVGKQWRFPRDDFERWLRSRQSGSGDEAPAPPATTFEPMIRPFGNAMTVKVGERIPQAALCRF